MRSRLVMLGLWALGTGLVAPAGRTRAEAVAFSHYQVIVDRSPFGTVSGGGDAAPLPSFAERYTFAGLVPSAVTNQLLAVIHDSSRNRADLVAAGDTLGDIKIVKIDVAGENSKVTIQKGLEPPADLPLKARETAIAGVPAGPTAAIVPQPVPGVGQPPPGPTTGETRTVVMPARRRIPFRRGE